MNRRHVRGCILRTDMRSNMSTLLHPPKRFKPARLIMALCLVGAIFSPSCRHPSDNDLIEWLQRHRSDCDRIVKMMMEDDLDRISPASIEDRTSKHALKLSEKRWDEYHTLLQRLELELGVERIGDPPMVRFRVSSIRFFGGTERGLVYSEEVPPHLGAGSLDSWQGIGLAHRHIDGNWYIYVTVS